MRSAFETLGTKPVASVATEFTKRQAVEAMAEAISWLRDGSKTTPVRIAVHFLHSDEYTNMLVTRLDELDGSPPVILMMRDQHNSLTEIKSYPAGEFTTENVLPLADMRKMVA